MAKAKNGNYLLYFFLLLFLIFIIGKISATTESGRFYKEKKEAALRMEKNIIELAREGKKRGINSDRIGDVERNPLYGLDFSEITTTLGSSESKKTTINPNISAMVVDMLMELKIGKEEKVGVNFSSSFPAVNIAVLSALDTLGIEYFSITSMGASTYGGNNPEFSYLDMENFLYNSGLIGKKSDRVSYGGRNDLGEDINISILNDILIRTGNFNKLIKTETFLGNMEEKLKFYEENKIDVLINVGGNLTALGRKNIPYEPGILRKTRYRDKDSIMSYYLNKSVPVIHILNIKKLAIKYDIPIAPTKIQEVGEGDLYNREKYPLYILILGVIIGYMGVINYGFIKKNNKN